MQSKQILAITLLICTALLGLFVFYFQEQYLLFSILFIFLMMMPFFLRFERRKLQAKELVLIAMLAAIAAVSRVPFAALPSVQPTTFVIIISALVFGAETGFLIGAAAALVSNQFLGQGPWTPWQMFCWGMIGFTAGVLKDSWWMRQKWGIALFGILCGFLFGWVMNLSVLGFLAEISLGAWLTSISTSFLFDLAHAVSNVVFLLLFGASWMKILGRYKRKYGLLEGK